MFYARESFKQNVYLPFPVCEAAKNMSTSGHLIFFLLVSGSGTIFRDLIGISVTLDFVLLIKDLNFH